MPNQTPKLIPRFSIAEEISERIRQASRGGDVQFVVITRADGLVISHNFPDANLARRLAAMSAAIVGTAAVAAAELGRGALRAANVVAERGYIACFQAGDQAIVAGLIPLDADVDTAEQCLRRLADHVGAAIQRWERGDASE